MGLVGAATRRKAPSEEYSRIFSEENRYDQIRKSEHKMATLEVVKHYYDDGPDLRCSFTKRHGFPYELCVKNTICPEISRPIFWDRVDDFCDHYIKENEFFDSNQSIKVFSQMDIGITGHVGGNQWGGVVLANIHGMALLYRDTIIGSVHPEREFGDEFRRDLGWLERFNEKVAQTLEGKLLPEKDDNKMLCSVRHIRAWIEQHGLDESHYVRSMRQHFQSEQVEVSNRKSRRMPTLEATLAIKSDTGFSTTYFEISLLAKRVTLTREEREHTLFKSIGDLAGTLISLTNDLCSLFKELKDQEPNNFVLVIMKQQGCSLRQALDRAVELYNHKMTAYHEIKRMLPDSKNSQAVKDSWDSLLYYSRWNAQSPRYAVKYAPGDESYLDEYRIG